MTARANSARPPTVGCPGMSTSRQPGSAGVQRVRNVRGTATGPSQSAGTSATCPHSRMWAPSRNSGASGTGAAGRKGSRGSVDGRFVYQTMLPKRRGGVGRGERHGAVPASEPEAAGQEVRRDGHGLRLGERPHDGEEPAPFLQPGDDGREDAERRIGDDDVRPVHEAAGLDSEHAALVVQLDGLRPVVRPVPFPAASEAEQGTHRIVLAGGQMRDAEPVPMSEAEADERALRPVAGAEDAPSPEVAGAGEELGLHVLEPCVEFVVAGVARRGQIRVACHAGRYASKTMPEGPSGILTLSAVLFRKISSRAIWPVPATEKTEDKPSSHFHHIYASVCTSYAAVCSPYALFRRNRKANKE